MHAAEEVSNLFREHCKALLKDIEDLEGDGTVIQFLPHEHRVLACILQSACACIPRAHARTENKDKMLVLRPE